LSEALKTLSAAKRPRDIPKEWTRRRGRPLIPACREGRELAHRSLRPPTVQSARRAPAHRFLLYFFTKGACRNKNGRRAGGSEAYPLGEANGGSKPPPYEKIVRFIRDSSAGLSASDEGPCGSADPAAYALPLRCTATAHFVR